MRTVFVRMLRSGRTGTGPHVDAVAGPDRQTGRAECPSGAEERRARVPGARPFVPASGALPVGSALLAGHGTDGLGRALFPVVATDKCRGGSRNRIVCVSLYLPERAVCLLRITTPVAKGGVGAAPEKPHRDGGRSAGRRACRSPRPVHATGSGVRKQ